MAGPRTLTLLLLVACASNGAGGGADGGSDMADAGPDPADGFVPVDAGPEAGPDMPSEMLATIAAGRSRMDGVSSQFASALPISTSAPSAASRPSNEPAACSTSSKHCTSAPIAVSAWAIERRTAPSAPTQTTRRTGSRVEGAA